jgi:hypothetical protein
VDHVEFPVRVLVVVATPNDLPPIEGAADEVRAIEDAAAARYRGRARGAVDVLEHATPDALRSRLGDARGYDFVHVIAHGERTGRGSRIWLEDEDGDAVRLERDEFVDLLAGRTRGARQPRLIVLNTCGSADGESGASGDAGAAGTTLVRTRRLVGADAAAASLAVGLVRGANVPAVIGMAMQIRTPAAVAFSGAFYRTLFRHGQVDHAMLIGRREVQESDADWVAPRLYVGSPEPELFGVD